MKRKRQYLLCLATATIVLAVVPSGITASAQGQFSWKFLPEQNVLVGYEDIYEGDNAFIAECIGAPRVKIGIGAEKGVGRGEGENVKLTLKSRKMTVTLNGKSRPSRNFEMTAGVELVQDVVTNDQLFSLLLDDGDIKISGDLKDSWPIEGRHAAVRQFLTACKQ